MLLRRACASGSAGRGALEGGGHGERTQDRRLSGENPRIAKADGNAPVKEYIAAMPGWKREVGERLDALIVLRGHPPGRARRGADGELDSAGRGLARLDSRAAVRPLREARSGARLKAAVARSNPEALGPWRKRGCSSGSG